VPHRWRATCAFPGVLHFSLNKFGGAAANHVSHGIGAWPGYDGRRDRRVRNPQTPKPVDAQPIVHDGVRVSANLRRANSVAKTRRRRLGEINDVLWAGLRRRDDFRISNLIECGPF
jgi:hypothetical protein